MNNETMVITKTAAGFTIKYTRHDPNSQHCFGAISCFETAAELIKQIEEIWGDRTKPSEVKFDKEKVTDEMKDNIHKTKNLLTYLDFDDLRLMFYLRYIVDEWESKVKKALAQQEGKTPEKVIT